MSLYICFCFLWIVTIINILSIGVCFLWIMTIVYRLGYMFLLSLDSDYSIHVTVNVSVFTG